MVVEGRMIVDDLHSSGGNQNGNVDDGSDGSVRTTWRDQGPAKMVEDSNGNGGNPTRDHGLDKGSGRAT